MLHSCSLSLTLLSFFTVLYPDSSLNSIVIPQIRCRWLMHHLCQFYQNAHDSIGMPTLHPDLTTIGGFTF